MEKILVAGNADPVDDLLVSADAIRRACWWLRAGLAEHWPLHTADAAMLLAKGGEFDIDEAGLRDLIARRLLARPGLGESEDFEWTAADILSAVQILEFRQQWRATPSFHDGKKHVCQLVLEAARAENCVTEITRGPDGGPRFDVKHIFALLLHCDSGEGRAKLLALLRAVLEVDAGFLI